VLENFQKLDSCLNRFTAQVIGVETSGAASGNASLKASFEANKPTRATIPKIDTIANTLGRSVDKMKFLIDRNGSDPGARLVCDELIERSFHRKEKFSSLLVEDSRCVAMIEAFAGMHSSHSILPKESLLTRS
jgi:threonine dehydratase